MTTLERDAALARSLYHLATDTLSWLDAHVTDDQDEPDVDADALARMRRSVDWLLARLPADERARIEAGKAAAASLPAVAGIFVDVQWWVGACDEDEIDLDVAVKMQESVVSHLLALPDDQRDRLVQLLAELAAAEPHTGRRHELLAFADECGLTDDEEESQHEAPDHREWVRPEDR
ncbi:hypothetical protein ACFPIJ_36045 [Dactylosporangium cerinum]|uniref:Uncharacterized protein n=1 Tax=Dactylosporangium cerinum TaxID=1434730 RepID=A0ABV9W683_9ACTN